MSKVRSDLIGVVHAHHADGRISVLVAGDEVPEGVKLGDHVVEAEAGYAGMKVADLKAEIAKRNEGREDDAKVSDSGNKEDLVAALKADDKSDS